MGLAVRMGPLAMGASVPEPWECSCGIGWGWGGSFQVEDLDRVWWRERPAQMRGPISRILDGKQMTLSKTLVE